MQKKVFFLMGFPFCLGDRSRSKGEGLRAGRTPDSSMKDLGLETWQYISVDWSSEMPA